MLNRESIEKLLLLYRDDPVTLKFLGEIFDSFEEYHRAVFNEQLGRLLYAAEDADAYRDRIVSLDRARTVHHNSVIANVGILNRLAEKNGLPPVYDGVVSEERPYRREVANAVFAYLEEIINNRT